MKSIHTPHKYIYTFIKLTSPLAPLKESIKDIPFHILLFLLPL